MSLLNIITYVILSILHTPRKMKYKGFDICSDFHLERDNSLTTFLPTVMRFQLLQAINLFTMAHAANSMLFSLDPYNKYDSFYEQKVPSNLVKWMVNGSL